MIGERPSEGSLSETGRTHEPHSAQITAVATTAGLNSIDKSIDSCAVGIRQRETCDVVFWHKHSRRSLPSSDVRGGVGVKSDCLRVFVERVVQNVVNRFALCDSSSELIKKGDRYLAPGEVCQWLFVVLGAVVDNVLLGPDLLDVGMVTFEVEQTLVADIDLAVELDITVEVDPTLS